MCLCMYVYVYIYLYIYINIIHSPKIKGVIQFNGEITYLEKCLNYVTPSLLLVNGV